MDTPLSIPEHQDHILKGIACACAAFFFFTVMGALNKLLTGQHHVMEIVFYRNLLAVIPCCLYILWTRKFSLLKGERPALLASRVLVGTTGLYLTFATVQELPLSNATVLFFMATLLTPAFAHFFLKEHIGPHRWVAVLIGMSGVLLVAQPTMEITAFGVALGLGAAVCHACAQIILRAMRTQNAFTTTFYFFLGGTIVPGLFMPWVAQEVDMHSALILLGIAVSGGLGQMMITLAFKNAPASLLNPFNYTGLIWATGFDILIWNYVPGWPVFAGAGIILLSKLYFIYRERLQEKRKVQSL